MSNDVQMLINQLKTGEIQFAQVLAFIEQRYHHTPTAFQNGEQHNTAEQNQGSAKVLKFAQLNDLNQEDTLLLFAEHYQHVLDTPNEQNHQNIRQFMKNGWHGVKFDGDVLTAR